MSTDDPELDRLRERYPVGSLVRPGPGMVDEEPREVVDHTRMHPPFRRPMLVLKTPRGEIELGDPDHWRIDAS